MTNAALITIADALASKYPLDEMSIPGMHLHQAFADYVRACGDADGDMFEVMPELAAIVAKVIVGISCGFQSEAVETSRCALTTTDVIGSLVSKEMDELAEFARRMASGEARH